MRPSPRLCIVLLSTLAASCATERLHREGIQAFDRGDYEGAVSTLERALRQDPSNLELRLELRKRREAALGQLVSTGDAARRRGDAEGAAASYRRALRIDPRNDRALRGLEAVDADRRHAERTTRAAQLMAAHKPDAAEVEVKAVLAEDPGFAPASALLAKIDLARGAVPAVPRLKTRDDRPVSLQFRDAPMKMVFEVLARQTGLNFVFDKDVKSDGKTTIFVNQVAVEQAIDLVLAQNQLGRQVLSDNIVLVYPNTPAKQKEYRDEIVHTFYLTSAAPKDAEAMLKTVLGSKTLFVDDKSSTVVLRDTPERVRMAEKLVASLDVPEPEVIMEIEVVEITHSLAEQLGINYPGNVAFSPLKPLDSKSPGATGLVLSDLAKQSSNTIAISSLGVSVDLSKTVGAANLLSSPRIRARNREKAKILVGNRLPVVTSGTSATTGGSFSTSNVQYLDVGLTLDVQPTIHNDGSVAIKIGLEVSSIVKQITVPIGNGANTLAYQIGTRNTSTLLELKDGETQVLAGLIQDSDQRSSSHIPVLGDLPILGRLFGSNGTNRDKSEIVMSITPRVVRARPRPPSETTEFWYGSETQTRSAPFPSGTTGADAPGGVSFGAGGTAESAPAARVPSGPRAVPERIKAAPAPAPRPTEPSAPTDARAPPAGDAAASGAEGTPVEGGPRVTIDGPETAKIGEEVNVSIRLASSTPVGRIRTQVGFDASALQLVSAEPGDLARSGVGPKIDTRPGGVQLELAGGDAPLAGNGILVELRFRVVAARPAIAVTSQVVLVGRDGAAIAATQATPLRIAVAP